MRRLKLLAEAFDDGVGVDDWSVPDGIVDEGGRKDEVLLQSVLVSLCVLEGK
jgi:hypothetical protein